MSGIWDPVRRRLSAAAAGSGWCQVLERGACWWCLMLASRGAVYEPEQTATGTASGGARCHAHCCCTAVEVLDGAPLPARTRANGTTVTRYRGDHVHGTGFPGKTEFPGWTEDDITLAFQLAMACPQWTSLAGDRRRYRRDVHGVIVEVTWYPGPDGAPVIGHCYPLCGAGVIVNSPQGPVAAP